MIFSANYDVIKAEKPQFRTLFSDPSPPRSKRGSVRRQASIKATKSLGQGKVTKRKKKMVTEIITPPDQ